MQYLAKETLTLYDSIFFEMNVTFKVWIWMMMLYTTSRILFLNLRELVVSHLGGAHEKNNLVFFQVLIDALSKPKGIVVELITFTCIKPFALL